MPRYAHTQHGRTIRLSALVPLVFAGVFVSLNVGVPAGVKAGVALAMCAVAAVTLLFSSLTIEIDDDDLVWFFGPRLWRKRLALRDIASAVAVKNRWWYGLGIHRTPRGWLYNIGGLDAVEIATKDGRMLRLGTDEPEVLAARIAPKVGR